MKKSRGFAFGAGIAAAGALLMLFASGYLGKSTGQLTPAHKPQLLAQDDSSGGQDSNGGSDQSQSSGDPSEQIQPSELQEQQNEAQSGDGSGSSPNA